MWLVQKQIKREKEKGQNVAKDGNVVLEDLFIHIERGRLEEMSLFQLDPPKNDIQMDPMKWCMRVIDGKKCLTHDLTWIVCVQRSMETLLPIPNTVVVLIERIQINSMEQDHAVVAMIAINKIVHIVFTLIHFLALFFFWKYLRKKSQFFFFYLYLYVCVCPES